MIPLNWRPVASSTDDTFVVAPDERLSWPKTIGIGAQHVVAMFGATFLVPVLTGFPPATTLLFSGIGTLLFLIITGNRLPSYLGSRRWWPPPRRTVRAVRWADWWPWA